MWTFLALAALSLLPQQPGQLTLTNPRTTYGAPGVTRPDSRLLPGDSLVVAFDIEGITVDPNGKVLYSTTTECTDTKGKVLFKQDPRDLESINALGGNTVPATVQLDVGLDQPPGDYTVKVTVTDRATKRSTSLTRTFQVVPLTFGLVRLTTTADMEGHAPVSVFQAGGALWVNVGAVGFQRDKSKGQPDVVFEMNVRDQKGQLTMAKPFVGQINEKVPAEARFLPVQFLGALNRPGQFTVELKANDLVGKQNTTLAFPITVLPSK